jgi:hypothetical protein
MYSMVQVAVEVLVISSNWGQGALTTLCSTLHVREDKGRSRTHRLHQIILKL